jgi:hypothetical protein
LAGQIVHFAAVIRGEAEPPVTARDGLHNLRVTDAIVEAAQYSLECSVHVPNAVGIVVGRQSVLRDIYA